MSPHLNVLLQKSAKMINVVHERSLRIILSDYQSPYPLLLEKAHQTTFHQQCINSLIIEVYKHLSRHSPDINNDIFRLREDMYNLWNFHIFHAKNPRSLKYGLHATPYRVRQLLQETPTETHQAASLALFKSRIKTWKCENCPCRSCKICITSSHNMSVSWCEVNRYLSINQMFSIKTKLDLFYLMNRSIEKGKSLKWPTEF